MNVEAPQPVSKVPTEKSIYINPIDFLKKLRVKEEEKKEDKEKKAKFLHSLDTPFDSMKMLRRALGRFALTAIPRATVNGYKNIEKHFKKPKDLPAHEQKT